MKSTYIFFFTLLISLTCASQQAKFPEAEISNGLLKAHFYLPDVKAGYYQATRFDWSGLITSLEYKGHNYYGQWYDKYEPTIHDVVMGPVEEFGQIGFDDAKPGENFLKIGVGVLTRPDTSAYNSFKLYSVINHGTWTVKKEADQIQFVQILNDKDYSYSYSKTIQVVKGKPEMTISHILKNNGKKTLTTTVYDHNFLVIDKQTTGPGYELIFPLEVTGTGKGFGTIVQFTDKKMIFTRDLIKTESVYSAGLKPVKDNSIPYDIKVENIKSGAGVRITCDKPVLKMVFWASSTTVSPEPYIQINVEPGKEITWKINYEYYTLNQKK